MFDSYAQMYFKCYHIIFSTSSLKFKCKIGVQKEIIHNFKNHILVRWLTHFKKVVRVWTTESLLFCLRYDPLIVFRRQNHITFIHFHKNDVKWPLNANDLSLAIWKKEHTLHKNKKIFQKEPHFQVFLNFLYQNAYFIFVIKKKIRKKNHPISKSTVAYKKKSNF